MKVLYDHQIFTMQQYGGISRYFYELIRRFDQASVSCDVSMLFSENAYLNSDSHKSIYPFFKNTNFKGKKFLSNKVNELKNSFFMGQKNYDLFHPTYYDDYFLNKIGDKPFVMTYYDMIHEKFCDQFPEFLENKAIFNQKRLLAEKASRIIAISQTTKDDLIELFGVSEEKIDVVYLGNSLNVSEEKTARVLSEDYVLFVGNRDLYKNFKFWVISIADLIKENNLVLVCAGGGSFTIEEQELLQHLGIKQRVKQLAIKNDDVLVNLYQNALFFTFPSLYEGFGIPVLEAFATGCPQILSNGGSLPEVGGESVLYFDPADQQSCFNATKQLIDDSSLRNQLVLLGYEQLQQFSWDRTFEETLNVYSKVI